MRKAIEVAWYRFRARFARRWSGYLGIVLIIGLLGGVSMAAIAGARRTQSSYPTFVASVNASDVGISIFNGYGAPPPTMLRRISRLPDVEEVREVVAPNAALLSPDGAPRLSGLGNVVTVGSPDGEFVDQDRVALLQGRRADQAAADEIMLTPSAAQQLGLHLGSEAPVGLYSDQQLDLPDFGTPRVKPLIRLEARVVGIVELSNEVVQDDIDRAYGFAFTTAALVRELSRVEPLDPAAYELRLKGGPRDVPATERELIGLIPRGYTYEFHVTAPVVTEVELAVKPESIALGTFGAIAALVCLVLAGQAMARQVSSDEDDRRVIQSLGASRLLVAVDALLGESSALLVGAASAFVLAVALSPLAPIGPVRQVYPDGGVALDWTVLGAGVALIVVGLGAFEVGLVAVSVSRSRKVRAARLRRRSSLVRGAENAGLPVSAIEGLRLAVEPGAGGVPARSSLLGTALAVTLVVATLTFSSGLTTLVNHPALYGWNWSYTLEASNDVPLPTLAALNRDHEVAAWSGYDYFNVELDNQTVPVLQSVPGPRSAVSPPILSGHGLYADNQIVLGSATLAALHKRVGDTVVLTLGNPADRPLYIPPLKLRVVGTATFPAVGFASTVADHTSMGTGALIAFGVDPPAVARTGDSPYPELNGPNLVFVRLRPGVAPSAGRAGLEKIATAADRLLASFPSQATNDVTVLGVQRPAQIVNYRTIGSTPLVLAVGLALGAVVALGLTLGASVRRRRRELGLLKAIGFTRRQLAAAVSWQATFAAVCGVAAGVPLGIALGRQLWILFARDINAVPDPTVPVLTVVLSGVAALFFANVVAALPGRAAAATPTAAVLHAE